MRVVMQTPDRLCLKRRSGFLAVLGVPLLLAGLGAVFGSVSLAGGGMTLAAVLFAGLLGAFVGLCLATNGRGVTLDRRLGVAETWSRVAGVTRRRRTPLVAFRRVTLVREKHGARNPRVVFAARLEGACPALALCELGVETPARTAAERAARFLGLPMADQASGVFAEPRPEEPTRPFLASPAGEALSAPPDTKVVVESRDGELTLTLPPRGPSLVSLTALVLLIIPFGVACFAAGPIMNWEDLPQGPRTLLLGFLGVFCVLLPLATSAAIIHPCLRAFTRVTVSTLGLVFTQACPFAAGRRQIPAADVLDVAVPAQALREPHHRSTPGLAGAVLAAMARATDHSGVRIVSSRSIIEVGQGLTGAEKQWVCSMIRRALTS